MGVGWRLHTRIQHFISEESVWILDGDDMPENKVYTKVSHTKYYFGGVLCKLWKAIKSLHRANSFSGRGEKVGFMK